MTIERPGWGKLSQLVSDHVLGHKHRYELLSIVDSQGEADEIGQNGGPSRPGLDHLAVACVLGLEYFLHQMTINKWSFLERARHLFLL